MNRFPVENIDKVNSAKSADTASSSTTAEKLLTARDIVITGDLSGSASFNGASNVNISTTIKDDSHNHVISNIDNLQNTLNTMNTTISGKAASSHNHTLSQITDYSVPTLVNRSNYADKLTTARNITLSGDVTGTISFNGSSNVTIPATIANSGVTAGTYGPSANATLTHGGKVNIPCVTVSAKGQVTAAYNRVMTLPTVTASSIGAATFGLEKLTAGKHFNIITYNGYGNKYYNGFTYINSYACKWVTNRNILLEYANCGSSFDGSASSASNITIGSTVVASNADGPATIDWLIYVPSGTTILYRYYESSSTRYYLSGYNV